MKIIAIMMLCIALAYAEPPCIGGRIMHNKAGTACCKEVKTTHCTKVESKNNKPPQCSGQLLKRENGFQCCTDVQRYECKTFIKQKPTSGDELRASSRPNLQCIGGNIENRREGAYCCFNTNTLYCGEMEWKEPNPPPPALCTGGTVMRSRENYFCCRRQMVKNCNRIELPFRDYISENAIDNYKKNTPIFCHLPEYYKHPMCKNLY